MRQGAWSFLEATSNSAQDHAALGGVLPKGHPDHDGYRHPVLWFPAQELVARVGFFDARHFDQVRASRSRALLFLGEETESSIVVSWRGTLPLACIYITLGRGANPISLPLTFYVLRPPSPQPFDGGNFQPPFYSLPSVVCGL